MAVDAAGNVYVADSGMIRERTAAAGTVAIFVGTDEEIGAANFLVSTLAAIGVPVTSLAVDGAGNIYAANTAQDTVLKISSAGSVAILAGTPGSPGHADGPAAGALFNAPTVVAVDGAGNVFVYDSGGYSVRRITPAGVVSTLAGGSTPQSAGFGPPGDPADGLGSAAQFGDVLGMIADAAGDLFVTVFNEVREINPSGQVTNGAPISGANYSDLEINGISTLQGGSYSVVVTNAYGSTASTPAVTQSVGAFPLVPGAGDSALVVTLPPGNYTVEVGDVEVGTTGLALLEIYEIP